ncbi:hypothetical protein ACLKA7_002649 [Drosophila subpalustris]
MRDRLASLIVVKQEATASLSHNNNNNNTRIIGNEQLLPLQHQHQLQQQQHRQHHQQQQQEQHVQLLLPPPAIKCESLYAFPSYESSLYYEINNNSCYRQNLNNVPTATAATATALPALIYPCRNLFPEGCDIGHLGSASCQQATGFYANTGSNSWHSNGIHTCMYDDLTSVMVMGKVMLNNCWVHTAYAQYYALPNLTYN